MTNKMLNAILVSLNKKNFYDSLIILPLIENIFYGLLWDYDIEKLKTRSNLSPKILYLIKEQGKWVSVVYEMENDIHWYTLPRFRGRGILTTALRTYIIPHIFQQNKSKELSISINPNIPDYEISKKIAMNIGFKYKGDVDGDEVYSKTRLRNLQKIKISENVGLGELLSFTKVVLNYTCLLKSLSNLTSFGVEFERINFNIQKKLNGLFLKIEDRMLEENQNIQQN